MQVASKCSKLGIEGGMLAQLVLCGLYGEPQNHKEIRKFSVLKSVIVMFRGMEGEG